MKHIVETIEVTDDCLYLVDPEAESNIKVAITMGGEDISFTTPSGEYIVVDNQSFMGALKALTTKHERDRLNKR